VLFAPIVEKLEPPGQAPPFFFLHPFLEKAKDPPKMPRNLQPTEGDELQNRVEMLHKRAQKAREKYATDEAHREAKKASALSRYYSTHPMARRTVRAVGSAAFMAAAASPLVGAGILASFAMS
jgi:hypothetical protein